MTKNRPVVPKRKRNHVNPLAHTQTISFDGFSNNKPIIVDIGSYRGEFVEQLNNMMVSTHNFLVCEIRKPYAEYLRELFTNNANIAVFDGDSAKNLQALIEPSIKKGAHIEYVFINFPDPWFKDRHKKRRVVTDIFLQDTKKWIQSDTVFVFQTDQELLFTETQELLDEQGIEYTEFTEPLWGAQTHWELMKVKENNPIYRMTFSFFK